ncbi:MAG TPA: hypothetical protein VHH73_16680, partial [Verrucomicrobiae bacterium]|nr:hypothetical protein [Verrucomicrobiae bacterium]
MRRWLVAVWLLSLLWPRVRGAVFNYPDGATAVRWNLPLAPGVSTNNFNPATQSIRYYVASDFFSKTNSAAEFNAIQASFGQWQAIPG